MSVPTTSSRNNFVVMLLLAAVLTLAGTVSHVSAATYYVSPTGLSSSPGTQAAPWSLGKANAALVAGDTAILLDGVYSSTRVQPKYSGTAGSPITYRAANSRMAEFTNTDPRVVVSNRSYITIDGIKAHNGRRSVVGSYASHITINDCDFSFFNTGAFETNRFYHSGGYITFTNSHIQDGADAVHIREGSHHYIAGNTFIRDDHTNLVIMGVTNSVVENNFFKNDVEKCMEVFSLRGAFPPNEVICDYNVIQNNHFQTTTREGLQYAGNHSIIRRNVFDKCKNGMLFTAYFAEPGADPEGWFCANNRFYNNTVYKCRRAVATFTTTDMLPPNGQGRFEDNIVKNNILHGAPTSQSPALPLVSGGTYPSYMYLNIIRFGIDSSPDRVMFFNNNITQTEITPEIIWDGAEELDPPLPYELTVDEMEAVVPEYFAGNTVYPADMVDPENGDFTLSPISKCRDAGAPLTQTTSSGSGTVVPVEDALYFTDGYGLIDGDLIRVGDQLAQVVSVDYSANELTIDRSLSWASGTPVYTDYKGSAPDLGAFEADPAPVVAGRYLFYNNSAWDGNNPAANTADDAAIATDKSALLPGDQASFANYTSYSRGINGIMVDLTGATSTPTLDDFDFKVGNISDLNSFTAAPTPTGLTVRPGAGVGGADRVTITFADGGIVDKWLEVAHRPSLDVFYFGNAIGDTGNSASDAEVTPDDEVYVRNNPATLSVSSALISHAADFNRDKKVGPTDSIIARNNGTNSTTALQLIDTGIQNTAPIVNAGPDHYSAELTLPYYMTLQGSVVDDGYPMSDKLATHWSLVNYDDYDPKSIQFIKFNSPTSTLKINSFGTYTLGLNATDGEFSVMDTVEITVEYNDSPAPIFFEDNFRYEDLDAGWTVLPEGNPNVLFYTYIQQESTMNRDCFTIKPDSRMATNLTDTNLPDIVHISLDTYLNPGADLTGGQTAGKGAWLWLVDDAGAGFGCYFAIRPGAVSTLSVYTTEDDAETYTAVGTFAPASVDKDNSIEVELDAINELQWVYDRVNDKLDCYQKGVHKGTVDIDPSFRDFTRVIVHMWDPSDDKLGQMHIDNIRIADQPTWPIASP